MSHFTPRYMPWDERLCAVPDADLFKAISDGKASVVTDHIETFTETGIKLKSGKQLDADIIITATGLNIQLFGGVDVTLDGQRGDVGKRSEEHTSELQSLMRISYAVFCLKKKTNKTNNHMIYT